MKGRADLHIHSIHSDGTCTVEEVLRLAQRAGLSSISFTDHDSVEAVPEAVAFAERFGLRVIPGVEFTAHCAESEVHILGYFFDHTQPSIRTYIQERKSSRLRRAERIVGKLNDMQVPLRLEAVLEAAGKGSVCRPHIAHALVEEGLTETYHEAFYRFLAQGKPAYEAADPVSVYDVITIINEAGGVSALAHPGPSMNKELLNEIIIAGVDGIEVIHPSHSTEVIQRYKDLARERRLLESGGSDFHGNRSGGPDTLGRYFVEETDVELLQYRAEQ